FRSWSKRASAASGSSDRSRSRTPARTAPATERAAHRPVGTETGGSSSTRDSSSPRSRAGAAPSSIAAHGDGYDPRISELVRVGGLTPDPGSEPVTDKDARDLEGLGES